MNKTLRSIGVVGASFALIAGMPALAQANEPDDGEAIGGAAAATGLDLASVVGDVAAGETYATTLSTLTLPDAAQPLRFETYSEQVVDLELPAGTSTSTSSPVAGVAGNVALYSDPNGAAISTLVHDDGTVTLASIAETGDQSNLAYGLNVPDGASVSLAESGGVQVLDQDGNFIAAVSPPVAADAYGNEVPTEFVLTEEGFDQVTVLPTADDAYPVVTQARAGSSLINYFRWAGNDIAVHVTPLVAVVDPVTVAVPGWQQLLNLQVTSQRRTQLSNNATYNQQWRCHAAGKNVIGIAGFTGIDPRPAWGLEGSRGTRADFPLYYIHRCNW